MTLSNTRVSVINKMLGQKMETATHAAAGEVVALGRMEDFHTGDILTETGDMDLEWPVPLSPVFSPSIHASQRGDEVKLSGAPFKISEDDPV